MCGCGHRHVRLETAADWMACCFVAYPAAATIFKLRFMLLAMAVGGSAWRPWQARAIACVEDHTYGRRQFRRTIDGKRTLRARDIDDWPACIPDAHPGYISWERHQENLKILEANGRGFEAARASIPREGAGIAARPGRVWAMRQPSQGSLCGPAWPAGSLVHL